MSDIMVEPTGREFSIAGREYLVTFPDGTQATIWSPPWNDYTDDKEDIAAFEYAQELWRAVSDG